MDHFDIIDARKAPRRKRRRFDLVWNLLAIALLVMTLCVGAVVATIFMNPSSAWNPFPPPTRVPIPEWPTPTNTLKMTLEPSWTPTIGVPTQTFTPRPTNTPLVTATPFDLPPSSTPTVGATLTPGGFAFELNDGSPSWISSASFHPDLGCDWTGVAGQVLGINGEPVRSQFIHMGGSVEGQLINLLTITGSAPSYGLAGYEFTIANRLVATNDTLWIQLEDVQGLPMSDRIYFDTIADCNQNLVIIYLRQVR